MAKKFKGKSDNNANKIKIPGAQTISDADRANCLAYIFERGHATTSSFRHENDTTVRQSLRSFHAFSSMK